MSVNLTYVQCDQIGRFLKFFATTLAQIFGNYFGNYVSHFIL